MPKYALLANPGHNRVYFEESKKLAAAELALALPCLSVSCGEIAPARYGGVYYLTFTAEAALAASDLAVLSRLSFVYAIFEAAEQDEKTVLFPCQMADYAYIPADIGTILKYTGKTNELFTRMMINAALFASGDCEPVGKRLLDPVAGKGTTLFEGLVYGMDVYGVEVGDRAAAEACRYLQKYLQTGKYKFSMKTERVSGAGKSFTAERRHFELARSREEAKRGAYRVFEMTAGNSCYVNQLYKKSTFDVLVGDLPYGVQHGNVTNEGQTKLTRSPAELLRACLPAWRDVLKKNGVLALAWNVNVLPRAAAEQLLEEAGFAVLRGGAYDRLQHRVDQAILRDVLLAKKQ
ncbi:MAG: hypothetical protein KIG74_05535 [Clostridiaceae bacterium]|nr:hypothetical protein [Clostridiaceae bacterium]